MMPASLRGCVLPLLPLLLLLLVGTGHGRVASPVPSSSLSCLAPSAGWQLDVVSLLGMIEGEHALVDQTSCELITAINTCRDRSQACWNRIVGVDMASGNITFTVDLDTDTHNISSSSLGRLQLSSSGRLVYWHRHLVGSPHSNTSNSDSNSNSSECNEVVALTHGPGASVRWRTSQCGSSWAYLAVFRSLAALNGSDDDAGDVLLQMQVADDTADKEWRSINASTGSVLYAGVAVRNSSGQWLDVSVNDERSGTFTVQSVLRRSSNPITYTLNSSGVWTMRRQYSEAGPGAWSALPSYGSALIQRPTDGSDRWRSIDCISGHVLWQNDSDTSLFNQAWQPAHMTGVVMLDYFGNPDMPEMAIMWGVAQSNTEVTGVTGYLDGRRVDHAAYWPAAVQQQRLILQ